MSSPLLSSLSVVPPPPASEQPTSLEAAVKRCDELFTDDGSVIRVVADFKLDASTTPFATPMILNQPTAGRFGGSLCVMGTGVEGLLTNLDKWRGKLVRLTFKSTLGFACTHVYRVGEAVELDPGMWRLTMEDPRCFLEGKAWSYYTIETPTQRIPLCASVSGSALVTEGSCYGWKESTIASLPTRENQDLKEMIVAVHQLVRAAMESPEGMVSAVPKALKQAFKRKRPEADGEENGGL